MEKLLAQLRIPKVLPTKIPGCSLGGVNELYGLRDLISHYFDKQTYICEIGSYTGVSASLFAEMCGRVVTIDQRVLPGLGGVIDRYNNLTFIKELTQRAVHLFADATFDAVYIDADHTYEAVKRDIETWRPKVKPGGILCGHDYVTDEFDSMVVPAAGRVEFDFWREVCRGVRLAVDEVFPSVDVYGDSSWAVRLDS